MISPNLDQLRDAVCDALQDYLSAHGIEPRSVRILTTLRKEKPAHLLALTLVDLDVVKELGEDEFIDRLVREIREGGLLR